MAHHDRKTPQGNGVTILVPRTPPMCSLHTSEEVASNPWHLKKCYQTLTSIRETLMKCKQPASRKNTFLNKTGFPASISPEVFAFITEEIIIFTP